MASYSGEMKIALAIRHVAFEDLGTFAPVLEKAGYQICFVDSGVAPLDRDATLAADLLVVLGGPVGVYDTTDYPQLVDEIDSVRQRLEHGKATLGICLGAQIMAAGMGARVYPGRNGKEIGWGPLILTEEGAAGPLAELEGVPVLHWHGDTFDLPAGATLLASTERYPHQAFSLERHGLALQFHPEVDAAGLERWLIGHTGEIGATPGISVTGLRAANLQHAPRLRAHAETMLRGWLDNVPS